MKISPLSVYSFKNNYTKKNSTNQNINSQKTAKYKNDNVSFGVKTISTVAHENELSAIANMYKDGLSYREIQNIIGDDNLDISEALRHSKDPNLLLKLHDENLLKMLEMN